MLYPGAEKVIETRIAGGEVYKLATDDSPKEVREWYEDKIGRTGNVVFQGEKTVFTTNGITVVVTPEGGKTLIVITSGFKIDL